MWLPHRPRGPSHVGKLCASSDNRCMLPRNAIFGGCLGRSLSSLIRAYRHHKLQAALPFMMVGPLLRSPRASAHSLSASSWHDNMQGSCSFQSSFSAVVFLMLLWFICFCILMCWWAVAVVVIVADDLLGSGVRTAVEPILFWAVFCHHCYCQFFFPVTGIIPIVMAAPTM